MHAISFNHGITHLDKTLNLIMMLDASRLRLHDCIMDINLRIGKAVRKSVFTNNFTENCTK